MKAALHDPEPTKKLKKSKRRSKRSEHIKHAPSSERGLKEKYFKDIWKKRKEIIIAALFAMLFSYFIITIFLM